MVTFCPASFSTSAIYSIPVLPASPCSARSRRRNWSISAGVHCCTFISRAVSRISAFFDFKSSVIWHCLGAACCVFSWGWEAQAEVAGDPPEVLPAGGDTSPHSCCVPPGWRQKNARPWCWPQSTNNLSARGALRHAETLRRDCRSVRGEDRRAHTYYQENR